MKRSLPLLCAVILPFIVVMCFGGGLIAPPLSPVPGNGNGGGPTNGQTAAQVGVLINSSNTAVFAPTYIAQQSGVGSNDTLGTLTELNGKYRDLWLANGSHLRTNTIPPNDWSLESTNGNYSRGTGSVQKVGLTFDGNLVLPTANGGTITAKSMNASQSLFAAGAAFSVNQVGVMVNTFMSSESGKTNIVFVDSTGTWQTNDLTAWIASLPSSGGSAFPLSSDGNFNGFSGTNIWSLSLRTNIGGAQGWITIIPDFSQSLPLLKVIPQGDYLYAGLKMNTLRVEGEGQGGIFEGSIITTNSNGGTSSLQSNLLTTGTGIFNGGSVSLIPTNAALVSTVVGVAPSLPFGITNSLAGRAQPVVQYYVVDAVTGVPILTFSNETTAVKITVSFGALAVVQTNFTTLPITSTNTIWRARNESTGTGTSVGILTNWFIGL